MFDASAREVHRSLDEPIFLGARTPHERTRSKVIIAVRVAKVGNEVILMQIQTERTFAHVPRYVCEHWNVRIVRFLREMDAHARWLAMINWVNKCTVRINTYLHHGFSKSNLLIPIRCFHVSFHSQYMCTYIRTYVSTCRILDGIYVHDERIKR